MLSIVAQSARVADGETTSIPAGTVQAGSSAAERFLLEWRGEADPKHITAVDTYWICTVEHGMNASTFTGRASRLRPELTAPRLSPRPWGAFRARCTEERPARVLPMLDAAAAADDIEKYVVGFLDSGERLMGFGHRVYRAEDPRARLLRMTAKELGLGALRSCRGARARRARRAAGAKTGPRAGDQRGVLVGRGPRCRRDSGPARARHVRHVTHRRAGRLTFSSRSASGS